jgi:glyoxylase-like metal-dependent hydrolase (beta-lactamase superfamily II)
VQVTSHIHALKIPFQVRDPFGLILDRFVYVYLIYGKRVYIIDTGVASSERVIFDYLKKTSRKPQDIALILQTHSHPDHIGSTKMIQKKSGCIVAADPREKAWIEDVELQEKERPVPGFKALVGGPCAVTRLLKDKEVISLDEDLKLKVLATPGHSRGCVSFLFQQDKALFTGDAIPLVGDLPIYEDVLATVKSIKKLQALTDIDILLASWDHPRRGERVKEVTQASLRHLQRIHEVVVARSKINPLFGAKELTLSVMAEFGLPKTIVNPRIIESVSAHMKARAKKNLLKD